MNVTSDTDFKIEFDGNVANTPWGDFDVSTPRGIVCMGLAQLSTLKAAREINGIKIEQKLIDDIDAYKWIVENNKYDEYMELKRDTLTPVRLIVKMLKKES